MNSPCPDAVPISTQCPNANPFENLSSEAFDGLDYLSTAWSYGDAGGGIPSLGKDWTSLQGGGTVVSQISQLDADLQAFINAVNDAVANRRRRPRRRSPPLRPLFLNEAQTACVSCPAPYVGSGCFTVPSGRIYGISQEGADGYAYHVASILAARHRICFDLRGQASPPRGQVGTPYFFQLTVTGGTPPYLFYIVEGTLPIGLELSSDGVISGTPLEIIVADPVIFGVSDSTPS